MFRYEPNNSKRTHRSHLAPPPHVWIRTKFLLDKPNISVPRSWTSLFVGQDLSELTLRLH